MTDTVETSMVASLERLGATDFEQSGEGHVNFSLRDREGVATATSGGDRMHVVLELIPHIDVDSYQAWAQRHPDLPGVRTVVMPQGKSKRVLLVFERLCDPDRIRVDDPVPRLLAAILEHRDLPTRRDVAEWVDASLHPPVNAWLMKGDEGSYPSAKDLARSRAAAGRGFVENTWTAAKQTEEGDLLLFYFGTPRKAVHFVARAASDAFFSDDIAVNADREVADQQWWVHLTPLTEIQPVSFAQLREANRGDLILKGRSGLYLRPDVVDGLPLRAARTEDEDALSAILQPVVGRADAPPPDAMTLQDWRDLASGALPLERKVEEYVVEPLLRLMGGGNAISWERGHRVGRGVADYAVTTNGRPTAMIEVKLRVRTPRGGDWSTSAELAQLRRYTAQDDLPGALIDAQRIYLVDRGAHGPRVVVERRTATRAQLSMIRDHLAGADDRGR